MMRRAHCGAPAEANGYEAAAARKVVGSNADPYDDGEGYLRLAGREVLAAGR
jgi:hypothetical protein